MKKNDKSVLEQFYEGELLPSERITVSDPEYRLSLEKADRETRFIMAQLNDEGKERFDNLADIRNRISSMDGYANFACGFRLGALFMLEILTGELCPGESS